MVTIADDILGSSGREKTINSKRKGNRNEIVAAKWLEKWTGQEFARTPSSGGLRWGQDASFACGDVVCKNEKFDFIFAVETKHLKAVEFKPHLSKRSKIYTIFQKAYRDAERAGKLPLLMLRTNGMEAGKFNIFSTVDVMNKVFEGAKELQLIRYTHEIYTMSGTYETHDGSTTLVGVPSDFVLKVPYQKVVSKIRN